MIRRSYVCPSCLVYAFRPRLLQTSGEVERTEDVTFDVDVRSPWDGVQYKVEL